MFYIVFVENRDNTRDTFRIEFKNKKLAVEEAVFLWSNLKNEERKVYRIYVMESEDPDEEYDYIFPFVDDYVWHSDFERS